MSRTTDTPEVPPRRRRPNPVIVALALLGTLQLIYLNLVEADRMVVHRREVARLEREVAAFEQETAALEEIARHVDDDLFREQLARKQGFIHPDELLVVTQSQGRGH